MTKTSKITLAGGRDLSFSLLRLSQSNVRRIQDGQSIEDLAEDIARRGLLQSLSVRPILDDAGADTGLFEVPAGGRRFRALELLVKQKRLAKDAPIPCIIRTGGLAEEDSLAENVQRLNLHPIEQFYAFKILADKGLSEEDIAARFFVPVTVVKQRLKLALVSPVILNAYEAGTIALEIVMAFTVNPDTERQEAVYNQLTTNRDLGTYRIKRLLTESTVAANDRRVRFVTMDAYIEAGGVVLRDLFTDDNGGWLSDPALLDRLVAEQLSAAAEEIKAQGWKWVETAVDFPYGHTLDLDELVPEVPMLSDDDSGRLKVAVEEYNGIMAIPEETGEELSDTTAARADELDTLIQQLENPAPVYKPEDMAIAGVFIELERDGTLVIDPGFVRPEDRRPEPNDPVEGEASIDSAAFEQALHDTFSNDPDGGDEGVAGQSNVAPESLEPEDMSIKPLQDSLHRELTAYRTLVLRNAVAQNPAVALTALLHKLCRDAFNPNSLLDCLEVRVTSASLSFVGGPDLKDCLAGQEIADRAATWRGLLPKDDAELWDYLVVLSDDLRAELLAHLVSSGINALYEAAAKPGYNGTSAISVQHRLADSNRIAETVGLDLVASGWAPSIDNYLGRVPKPRILLAVEQGCGADAAGRIDHLKKPDMAAEAEALLKTSGWLPEPLRGPQRKAAPVPPNDNEPTAAAIPSEDATREDALADQADGFAEAAE
ncbi:ParB/RepB/Spo0J family partition protein [Asticcacaulis sp.]|uniref:ParB/RepB/Spo0J family partition protein n=1 Tax=Asticcacaulis sp. TaxID=1872648 RepID=UPI002BD6EF97|nr:ParB N-terminal domain-containing protein [Asticcacaulis sp.]HTM82178.1 ParB N-terminal domain-containing protein [Asticcacaulis sp.]